MVVAPTDPRDDYELAPLVSQFEKALGDDLDTPTAIDVLRELDVIAGNRIKQNGNIAPVSGMYSIFERVLGLFS